MAGPLYRVGRFCSRHHWLTIAAWVVLAVAVFVAGQRAEGQTNDNLTLPGTGSTIATELLEDNIPGQAYGANPLTMVAPEGKLTESKYQEAIAATVKRLEALSYVSGLVDPLSEEGKSLFARDGTVVYIPVYLSVSPGDLDETEARRVLDAAQPAAAAGLETSVGGYVGSQLSQPSTESSEAIGLAAAVVVLLIAFGTATAMSLPIVSAIFSLATSLSIIRLLESVIQVPSIATTLATMIGLGVGIDYALFIVTRHKTQLAEGMELRESIARAVATAGGAVVFAGFTVVIALASLWVAGINIVSTLGFTAAVAVIGSVCAAITLLPALLGALGPRIDSLRVRAGDPTAEADTQHGWRRWGRRIVSRPRSFGLAALVALLVLAIPMLDLTLGQNDVGAMPTSTPSRQSYDALSEGFGPGLNGPLLIAAEFSGPEEAEKVLPSLQKAVKEDPDVGSGQRSEARRSGDRGGLLGDFEVAPSDDATVSLVERLRNTDIPATLQGSKAHAYVGGETAGYIDLAAKISDKLPQMIATVIALAIRGPAARLPLAARPAQGGGDEPALDRRRLRRPHRGLPVGLGRVADRARRSDPDRQLRAAADVRDPLRALDGLRGLPDDRDQRALPGRRRRAPRRGRRTRQDRPGDRLGRDDHVPRLRQLRSQRNPIVKEFGVGLAVAIAIDVGLVRFILVPAVMALVGERMWWLPSWLDRILPPFSVEGEGYFAERDADAARESA